MHAWHVPHMGVGARAVRISVSTHTRHAHAPCTPQSIPGLPSLVLSREVRAMSPRVKGRGEASGTSVLFRGGADSTDRGVTLGVGRGAIDSLLLTSGGAMLVER